MGRYPQVPSTDAHPLSRRAREAAEAHDEDSGMDVAALCASWRERAGKPGATVILEVEAMLRNAAADARPAPAAGPTLEPAHRSRSWFASFRYARACGYDCACASRIALGS